MHATGPLEVVAHRPDVAAIADTSTKDATGVSREIGYAIGTDCVANARLWALAPELFDLAQNLRRGVIGVDHFCDRVVALERKSLGFGA